MPLLHLTFHIAFFKQYLGDDHEYTIFTKKISLFTYFAIFLVFLNFNDTLAADELLDIALDAFIPAFAPFPTYDPGT